MIIIYNIGASKEELQKLRGEIMATLQELKDAVAENISVGQSVVTLIDGLLQRIQDLITGGATAADYQALVDELKAETAVLAGKVAENTTVDEPPIV